MTDLIEDQELPQMGNSKFLKGSDLKGKLKQTKISAVGQTTFADGRSARTITVQIDGDEKSFSLNKTNVSVLAQAFGRNTKAWIGKSIALTSTQKQNPTNGQMVDSILIVAN